MKITQETLRRIVEQKAAIQSAQEALTEQEDELLLELKRGATVEPGALTATIKTWSRRVVAWKQVCQKKLGAAFCRRVLAATQANDYERLKIESAA